MAADKWLEVELMEERLTKATLIGTVPPYPASTRRLGTSAAAMRPLYLNSPGANLTPISSRLSRPNECHCNPMSMFDFPLRPMTYP